VFIEQHQNPKRRVASHAAFFVLQTAFFSSLSARAIQHYHGVLTCWRLEPSVAHPKGITDERTAE
jgi:hypothetical protein